MDDHNLTAIPTPGAADPPARHGRQSKPGKDGKPSASRSDGLRAATNSELASDDGKACFAKRQQAIESVFGQINELQGTAVPAPGLAACDAEWSCCAAAITCSSCGGLGQATGGQLSRHPGGDAATAVRGR